jgi:signal peptidase II
VLRLQTNSGIAFGIFQEHLHPEKGRWLVMYKSAMAAGLLLLLAWRILARPGGWVVPVGLVALLGGTLGNLVDRARTKAVTDFIDLRLGGLRWPAFNLADLFLAVGLVLCVIGLVMAIRRRRGQADDAAGLPAG